MKENQRIGIKGSVPSGKDSEFKIKEDRSFVGHRKEWNTIKIKEDKNFVGNRKEWKKIKMKRMKKSLDDLREENSELKDFCIWMTGCGYNFTQHPYFVEQRNKYLTPIKENADSESGIVSKESRK